MDINDYNGNYEDDSHFVSPGKTWEQTGPYTLLGYSYIAPGDAGGAPVRIMQSWLNNRSAYGDVGAWMKANADNRAWNACAIVKGTRYVYFSCWLGFRKIKESRKENW